MISIKTNNNIQTKTIIPYKQLIHTITIKNFPNITITIQNILTNQKPILNKHKLTLYLKTINTQNIPIIHKIISTLKPYTLFPKHYKYTLIIKTITTKNSNIINTIYKQILPKYKLSKKNTIQLLKKILNINNIHPITSIYTSLKNQKTIKKNHTYYLLLQTIKSKNPSQIIYILHIIKPKKTLTLQQNSTLIISSIKSNNLKTIHIILKLHKKYPTKIIKKYLYQTLTSNTNIFLHLIHKIKPKISNLTLNKLLNKTYIINKNQKTTYHILKHYPPPSNITNKFLKIFIQNNNTILIPIILTHITNLTNKKIQYIYQLSLNTYSNLFIFFTKTHNYPKKTITKLFTNHFQQTKIKNKNKTIFQPKTLPNTIIHLIQSLQYSKSKIITNLLLHFTKSNNIPTLQLFYNSFIKTNKNKHIIHIIKTLLSISSNTKNIKYLLNSIQSPSPKLLTKLNTIINKNKINPNLIKIIQHYKQKLKHIKTKL